MFDLLNRDLVSEISHYLFHIDLRRLKFAFPKTEIRKDVYQKQRTLYNIAINNICKSIDPDYGDILRSVFLKYLYLNSEIAMTVHQVELYESYIIITCTLHEDIFKKIIEFYPIHYPREFENDLQRSCKDKFIFVNRDRLISIAKDNCKKSKCIIS